MRLMKVPLGNHTFPDLSRTESLPGDPSAHRLCPRDLRAGLQHWGMGSSTPKSRRCCPTLSSPLALSCRVWAGERVWGGRHTPSSHLSTPAAARNGPPNMKLFFFSTGCGVPASCKQCAEGSEKTSLLNPCAKEILVSG